MSVSVYPQVQTGVDAWLTSTPSINLDNIIAGALKIAQRSAISTLHIGETGVINSNESQPGEFQAVVVSKEKEAEFYDKLIKKTQDKVNGYSIFYGGPSMSIKGDPAETVIKQWFKKLGN